MASEQHINSYSNVASTLIRGLRDQEQSVIVLRGLWGTGKTYLWHKVRSQLRKEEPSLGRSVYVSLFGLKTIESLKWNILRSAYSSDKSATNKVLHAASKIGAGWLGRTIGTAALDTALLWLPDLLSTRLIVIDDVERKHPNLSIDELLGFLEEYTELYKTRFLLLMNDIELDDNDTWRLLREKVVDIEILLKPSPTDAFLIASAEHKLPQLDRIRLACVALDITNIRIIRKAIHVVKALDRIVGDNVKWNPWPQSAVLLTAIHFHGITDPPSIEFIRTFNQFSRAIRGAEAPTSEREQRWERMLKDVGMHIADAFESLVYAYLETGLLDESGLKALFDSYQADAANRQFQEQLSDFFTSMRWEPNATNQSLCEKAARLLDHVDRLGADMAGDLANLVTTELDNSDLGQQIIDAWIAAADFKEDLVPRSPFPIDNEIARLHPRIAEKIRSIRAAAFPPKSLRAAIAHIARERSWGEEETLALKEATVETYRGALEEMSGDELRRFVQQHAHWIKSSTELPVISSAVQLFLKACRDIVQTPPSGRLAEIIRWFFQAQGLSNLLEPPDQRTSSSPEDQLP